MKLGRYKLHNGQKADVTVRSETALKGVVKPGNLPAYWTLEGKNIVSSEWDLEELMYSTEGKKRESNSKENE